MIHINFIKKQNRAVAYDNEIEKCVIQNSEKCNKNLIAECSYAKKVLETNNNISES